jgi:hypothetical protein
LRNAQAFFTPSSWRARNRNNHPREALREISRSRMPKMRTAREAQKTLNEENMNESYSEVPAKPVKTLKQKRELTKDSGYIRTRTNKQKQAPLRKQAQHSTTEKT